MVDEKLNNSVSEEQNTDITMIIDDEKESVVINDTEITYEDYIKLIKFCRNCPNYEETYNKLEKLLIELKQEKQEIRRELHKHNRILTLKILIEIVAIAITAIHLVLLF